jgi:hypothetical protein
MQKKKYCLKYLFLLIICALIATASFAASSSTNFEIPHQVVDSGGTTAASANYEVLGKARDKAVDTPFSALYKIWEGFLNGVIFRDWNPPARIDDLAATTGVREGEVDLTWTAVGDDGHAGRATRYIVKYSNTPITTRAEFDAATTYVQTWTPETSGSTESKVLTGLDPGEYLYFAIIAVDESGLEGDVSNSPAAVVQIAIDDPVKIVGRIEHEPKIYDPKGGTSNLTLDYVLNRDAYVSLIIFKKSGDLIYKRNFAAGTEGGRLGMNSVVWSGISDFRQIAANGVYVYHIILTEGGQVKSLGRGKFVVFR